MKQKHFYLALIVLILLLFSSIAYNLSFRSFLFNNYPSTYQQYYGEDNKIIVIPLFGELTTTYSGQLDYVEGLESNKLYADKIAKFIRSQSKKGEVKGFIFEIDSVGGNFEAGEEIRKVIDDVDKPIISLVRSNALSNGIEVSSESDYVFISQLSDIGDIGVVIPAVFSNRNGKEIVCWIPSNKFKNVYLPQCDPKLINPSLYSQIRGEKVDNAISSEIEFTKIIANARNLSFEEVSQIGISKIMTGKEAVRRGLADEFGNMNDALEWFEDREGQKLRLEYAEIF